MSAKGPKTFEQQIKEAQKRILKTQTQITHVLLREKKDLDDLKSLIERQDKNLHDLEKRQKAYEKQLDARINFAGQMISTRGGSSVGVEKLLKNQKKSILKEIENLQKEKHVSRHRRK
ncbi:MAG: hypothetical protein JSR17_08250 [Proteobacteria bacterium]|nr:hypothetical protein [Pseudomonadota bacterium]